jgi:hypothetical protein
MQCSSCGTQIPIEVEFSREVSYCPDCGRMVSSGAYGSAVSPDGLTARSSSEVPGQSFPSTSYGSSSYELMERNPYGYNPYGEQSVYRGVDTPQQVLFPSESALPQRGGSQFIRSHYLKLLILISVLLLWVSFVELATKPADIPNRPIDNFCVLLLLISWPTSLIIALYQTGRLKRWGWFVCILLFSPLLSVGSFVYVPIGPTRVRYTVK